VNTARWHIAFAHYRLGELRQAVEVASALHKDAADIGDQAAAGISLSAWSRASAGQIPAGLTAAELAKGTDDAHTATEVRLAEAVRLLALAPVDSKAVDAAISVLDEARRIVRRAGLP